MNDLPFGGLHLGSLPLLKRAQTRSICAENPTGAVGGGARETPDQNSPASMLGKGWKVRPAITLPAESVTTIASIEGPGVIQHIWITVDKARWRDLILRIYWDDESAASIETPLGDFFACGHNLPTTVNSIPIAVNPLGGFNSYWPMPFRRGAKVTIENQFDAEHPNFFYQITYSLEDVPPEAAYLHAQWRRSLTRREGPEHVIVDGISGRGHYVGTYMAWQTCSDMWWGEGEVKFYLDGDGEHPTICGTGTEDYFGGAWGFWGKDGREEAYSTPYLGMPLVHHQVNHVPKFGLYRWHVLDPIRFERDLRATVQTLGWTPHGKFQPLTEDIASVAYWYQTEPHAGYPALPDRWSRLPK